MKVRSLPALLLAALTLASAPAAWAQASSTVINSLERGGRLTWSTDLNDGIAVIEKATDLPAGPWSPILYDRLTAGTKQVALPYAPEPEHFYRIQTIVQPADPSLLLSLSFNNDFSQGTIFDLSGYANHGERYHTNHWPGTTNGPDGSPAGLFRIYYDNYGPGKKSGDYAAIVNPPELNNLEEATILAWAHFYQTPTGQVDHTATIIEAANTAVGGWGLGRVYSDNTRFWISGPGNTTIYAVRYPDATRTGNTGGWNHYAATFNRGAIQGFYNGTNFLSTNVPITKLIQAGKFMCVSCWNHGGTPEWDDNDGGYPNNAFMNGAIDDIRIYGRVLTPEEIKTIVDEARKAASGR